MTITLPDQSLSITTPQNAFIALIKALKEKWQGQEMTQDIYLGMLEAVPPAVQNEKAFLVGEIAHHSQGKPYYDAFYCDADGFFYCGRLTMEQFNLFLN
jgi:hypothetical protein